MPVTAALADIIETRIFLKRIDEEMTDRLNPSPCLNKRFTPLVFKRIICAFAINPSGSFR
jgi:hypothetical protein